MQYLGEFVFFHTLLYIRGVWKNTFWPPNIGTPPKSLGEQPNFKFFTVDLVSETRTKSSPRFYVDRELLKTDLQMLIHNSDMMNWIQ